VLLCCLGGLSQEEAARRLGWTPDSVRGRLERGRARLADRLSRRGVSLGVILAGVQAPSAPPALAAASTGVMALADAAMGMVAPKVKAVAAMLLLVGLSVAGVGVLAAPRTLPEPDRAAVVPAPAVELRAPTAPPLSMELHNDAFWGLAYSPDGKRLAGAAHDGAVWVWDATTGKRLLAIPAGERPATGVCFSCDGKTLASVSDKIRLYDATTGEKLPTLDTGTRVFSPYDGIAFSPDDKVLAGCVAHPDDEKRERNAGDDTGFGRLRLWDVTKGEVIRDLADSSGGPVAFSPDGKRVAGLGSNGTLRVWDVATGKEVLRLATSHPTTLAFSPDGKTLVAGTPAGTLIVHDATTGKELRVVRGAHEHGVVRVAITPDGRYHVSAGRRKHVGIEPWAPDHDGEIKVWDAATGKELFGFKTHVSGVSGMALDPAGTRVAASTLAGRQPVKVWSLAD
jgi:WD40 repeat protein